MLFRSKYVCKCLKYSHQNELTLVHVIARLYFLFVRYYNKKAESAHGTKLSKSEVVFTVPEDKEGRKSK